MTGFGRVRLERNNIFVSVELSSVNNRHLEVNFSLPQERRLEKKVKRKIKNQIDRGNVDVKVTSNVLNQTQERLTVNEELLDEYIELIDELEQERNDISGEINVLDLLEMPGILSVLSESSINEEAEELLLEAIDSALSEMIEMREREGEELQSDLYNRSKNIIDELEQIEERYPEALQEYREKLHERFDDLLEFDEERINDEIENQINKYADKSDISEEIVRVESHLKQFQNYLENSGAVGKELKFLLQEMQREINTIGAKGNDAKISQLAVSIKSELEKCREQVKNVE